MIGQPLSAEEWCEITNSNAGEEIAAVLAPWYQGELEFKHVGDLHDAERILEAFSPFDGFGHPTRIRFMSESRVRVLFGLLRDQLPFCPEYYITSRMSKEYQEAEKGTGLDFYAEHELLDLADCLEGAFGKWEGYGPIMELPEVLVANIRSALLKSLFEEHCLLPLGTEWKPEYEFRGYEHEGAQYTFEMLVVWQVAFLATGKPEEAEKVGNLLEFYRKGFVFWICDTSNQLWVCTR